MGTYIVIFMSLDRFVGVWFPMLFKKLTQPPFDITNRLVFTTILCFGLHVVFMVDAEVQCLALGSLDDNCTVGYDSLHNCTSDTYISNDGFEKSFNEHWHVVYRYFYNLLVRWLPCAVLIVLNISLVLAVVSGRVKYPKNNEKDPKKEDKGRKRQLKNIRQEKVLVVTAIAMTASYVVMTMPITIFLTSFASANDCRCEKPSPEETLRHVGNILQLTEHILHSIYLFLINRCFRRELLCLLKCRKSPNNGFVSDELSISTNSRPLSTVSRYSIKACRESMAPLQYYKPSCGETVEEETLEETKSLSKDTLDVT